MSLPLATIAHLREHPDCAHTLHLIYRRFLICLADLRIELSPFAATDAVAIDIFLHAKFTEWRYYPMVNRRWIIDHYRQRLLKGEVFGACGISETVSTL